LPVRLVEKRVKLEPSVVYLVPADRHVEITDHQVQLSDAKPPGRPKPSIDHLLTTAARVFGENLVPVILTRPGTDGVNGARTVKAAGGTVIIQDPESATFPAMPSALPATSVDIVASLDSLAKVLAELVGTSVETRRPDEERLLNTFLQQLR